MNKQRIVELGIRYFAMSYHCEKSTMMWATVQINGYDKFLTVELDSIDELEPKITAEIARFKQYVLVF